MIGSGIIDTLNILNSRKDQFGDEDITEDLLYLEKKSRTNYERDEFF